MAGRKKSGAARGGILASRFYRIYFIAVAVALVGIGIGLVWLNGVAEDYERAQPVHAAELVAKLFEEGDYRQLYALDTSAQDISGGDESLYVESMSALAAGKAVSWREAYSPSADEKRYSVALDGERLATFTLVPSGKTTRHGNTLWTLGTVSTHVAMSGTEQAGDLSAAPFRVSAPSGYTVLVDGAPLTEANVLGEGTPLLPEGFLPSGVEAPVMLEYAFFSDSESPQVTVTDAAGAGQEVAADGENRWTCPLAENVELREKYGQAVIKLSERIAKYTVADLSRDALMKGVASESPAETILRKFNNDWAPPHKTATVTDAVVSDFYVLSEDCFTCHVEFTFTLTSRRNNDYVYPTAYTLCVVRRRGEGRLYNLLFN